MNTKNTLNILLIKGYFSRGNSVSDIEFAGIKVKLTTIALGQPIFVKRTLKNIINKYKINSDYYDLIYAISMSACISPLIDKSLYKKLHLITPFFIHHKTMLVLRKVKFRKLLGAYFLLLMNGRLYSLNNDIKVTLAENDAIVDNDFFRKNWQKVNLLESQDHDLDQEHINNVIKKDIQTLQENKKKS